MREVKKLLQIFFKPEIAPVGNVEEHSLTYVLFGIVFDRKNLISEDSLAEKRSGGVSFRQIVCEFKDIVVF